MTDINLLSESEEAERRARRAERIAEMKRVKELQRKRREMIRKAAPFVLGGVCLLVVVLAVSGIVHTVSGKKAEAKSQIEKEVSQGPEMAAGNENGSGTGGSDVVSGNSNTAESEAVQESADTQESTGVQESAGTQENSGMQESTGTQESIGVQESGGATGIGVHAAVQEGVTAISKRCAEVAEGEDTGEAVEAQADDVVTPYVANVTEDTVQLGGEIVSENVVLIDLETDSIVARKAEKERISPASMTKVLTVLVAAEHVTNLDDTFTITIDITDYSYVNDCSNVGFARDETVTVRDLFYGTILPSGADAAVGLATYVAGSHEEFVKLMNEKLDELGLSDTAHFTNCVGIYDEDHYCTVYDMAVIMKAAMDNELCREVMSAHTYTTSATTEHPEGITISNWFLRRIEDKDSGGEVLCGKTGYVVQSGNCAASYGISRSGKGYVCVTAHATSGWKCIYDHADIYRTYMDGGAKNAVDDGGNPGEDG